MKCASVTITALSLLVLAMTPRASAHAQRVGCDPAKSAQECFSSHSKLAEERQNDAGTKAVEAGTAGKPTGNEASIPGSETAIKDFLPRFATALAIPGLSSTPKALGLRFNANANDAVWHLPFTIQLEGIANEGRISEALVNNVPSARREAVGDSVTKTLSDFADIGFSFALNFENEKWGRSIASNRIAISRVMAELFAPDTRKLIARQSAFSQVLQAAAPTEGCGAGLARVNMPLTCFSATEQKTIVDTLLSLSQAYADFETQAKIRLERAGLDRLEDLLNGQPQLNTTAHAKSRDNLVGPNEQTATLRFEWSPVNLNRARDFCQGKLALQCLATYLSEPGIKEAIDRGHRFWATVDFTNVARYDFAIAADSARVVKPRSLAFEPAIGYGAYVGIADRKVRADVELRYRRSDNQSVREDRTTATATLTQKLNDQSNATLSIKWASKPEFLGDVDHQWRANLGYSYKISDIGK